MIDAMLCGVSAFVFIGLLCEPYEAFEWWPKLVRKALFGSTAIVSFDDMKWWQLLLYKPLAGCEKCQAGWIAIAYFLANKRLVPFDFLFFVSVAILTAWALAALKEQIEQ